MSIGSRRAQFGVLVPEALLWGWPGVSPLRTRLSGVDRPTLRYNLGAFARNRQGRVHPRPRRRTENRSLRSRRARWASGAPPGVSGRGSPRKALEAPDARRRSLPPTTGDRRRSRAPRRAVEARQARAGPFRRCGQLGPGEDAGPGAVAGPCQGRAVAGVVGSGPPPSSPAVPGALQPLPGGAAPRINSPRRPWCFVGRHLAPALGP